MSQSATLTALEELHQLVAEALKEGVRARDPRSITAAIKFLKDNGIEPASDADNSALKALNEQLNRLDLDQDGDDAFLN